VDPVISKFAEYLVEFIRPKETFEAVSTSLAKGVNTIIQRAMD
jgi:hypothetical protein